MATVLDEVALAVVESEKNKGLVYDEVRVLNGSVVEFYRSGRRVKARKIGPLTMKKDIK
jgi:hypothetical protein